MASSSSQQQQQKKVNKKLKTTSKSDETPGSVAKLLAALQNAQNKSGASQAPSATTTTNNQKSANEKKKQQQQQNVNNANKRNNVKAVEQNQSSSSQKGAKQGGKKPKGSVASRMQQQGAEQQAKRQRNPSTSKPTNQQNNRGPRIPLDVLDDLEFRFISNVPESDKRDMIRICFQVELAHWFYIDHIVSGGERSDCPNAGIRDFTRILFTHCRELRKYANNVEDVIAQWREYKATVPTYGSILVDESLENVLLVQSWFAKGNSWGFPKGKVNQNEHPRDCAIRETNEETGFDFSTISNTEKRVQKFINDAMVRLYIVPNVPNTFPFHPQTRKEIRKIQWFKIADLPTDKEDETPEYLAGHKFFMVIPFVNELQRYVEREKEKRRPRQQATSILSQLFPNAPPPQMTEPSSSGEPPRILKRLTSEELFSSIRKAEEISRPTLPEISPSVDGVNVLATLGLCTPLKPGANLNNFPPTLAMPSVAEEEKVTFRRGLFDDEQEKKEVEEEEKEEEVGFAMPTALQQPVVISAQSWQAHRRTGSTEEQMENYQGWLGSQLVNTIMHPPNEAMERSSETPPSRMLSHLISKPIQPQPITPAAATPTAMGSAEAPKRSSRISLSDNSAFTAIGTKGGSAAASQAKQTTAPGFDKKRSESMSNEGSRSSTITPRAPKNVFASIVSPVSSGLRSIQGGSTSSLAASTQELSMINKNRPTSYRSTPKLVTPSEHWKIPIKLDMNQILPSVAVWENAFRISTH